KRTMMDCWRSMRVRDSRWNPSLRMLRRSGDAPFCSGLNNKKPHDERHHAASEHIDAQQRATWFRGR
ncbi:MAG: hypothetical protein J7457_07095, partial [Roseiflexus sp.]|nr:hypothetical protein [Roseiflexus sp.]